MKDIIIKYKRIKNIYIRVKPDLNIYITAPKRVSKKYIKELVEKRKEWIEERMEAMQKKNMHDIYLKALEDGNEIFYLGKSYMLKIIKSRRENIILAGRIMYMYVNIKNDLQNNNNNNNNKNNNRRKKELLLDIWYKTNAIKLFEELIKKYCSLMNLNNKIETFNITFTVKKLKSKWGSCDIAKKHIVLNLELMKYPIHAIEYIILHELTHLIYPNHSKDFYNTITLYMPEWKKEKSILDTFFNI